jgi:iron complex outermembrane receptor protein
MRKAIVLLVLLAAGSATAHAQTAQPLADLDLSELMRIEVQSVFGASKVLQKVTDAPAAVSIVTARDIALYGYRTLADVIRSVAGFNVTDDRNYSYVGVRGFQRPGDYNSRILLLIDGHRMNDPIYNQAYVGTEFPIDLELVDRVELIRGPSSSIHGTNAFLAVINVITKKGEALSGVQLSGHAGSLGTGRGRAAFGTTFANGLDVLVSVSSYESRGRTRLYFGEFDRPASNDGVAENLDRDASYHLFGSASFKGFSLQGVYGARDKRVPTAAFATAFNDPRFETRDAQGWLDLRYRRALADGWNVTGRAYYDRTAYDGRYPADSDAPGTPGVLFADYARGTWWGTEVNVEKRLGTRHVLTGGAEFRHNLHLDQGGFDVGGEVYFDDRRSSRDAAVFVEDQFAIHDTLLLNAGVRVDRYESLAATTNPRLALIFKPAEKTAIKAVWGTAFRAPNAYELYYSVGFARGGRLQPETIRTAQLVAERYVSDRYRFMGNVYMSQVRGLISQRALADGLLVFENLESATAHGAEVEVEAKWSTGIAARASYSYQTARETTTGARLVNSARHLSTGNVSVPLRRRALFAGLDLHYVGAVQTLDGTFARRFVVPNLTLSTGELRHGLSASVSVRNLFDGRYSYPGAEEHAQNIIVQNGRTVHVGLKYWWRGSR